MDSQLPRRKIVGVMGSGRNASPTDVNLALELGEKVAQHGWIVLSGGRNAGVMDAVSRGAKLGGGLSVGVLPREDTHNASLSIDIAIVTGMGSARNNINVLSSDAIVACGSLGSGTLSEIALALKANRPVVLLSVDADAASFLKRIGTNNIHVAGTVDETIQKLREVL